MGTRVVEGEPLGRWAGTVMIWGVGTEVGRGQSLRCRRHVEELRFPFKSNEKPLRISNARMHSMIYVFEQVLLVPWEGGSGGRESLRAVAEAHVL